MPRLVCYHCTKPKRCRMVIERGAIAYLCTRCARELGYTPRSAAPRPTTTPSQPQAAMSALRGTEART